MQEYRVSWTIEVEAESPVLAALQAWEALRDPESLACIFEVADSDDHTQSIDLLQIQSKGLDKAEVPKRGYF